MTTPRPHQPAPYGHYEQPGAIDHASMDASRRYTEVQQQYGPPQQPPYLPYDQTGANPIASPPQRRRRWPWIVAGVVALLFVIGTLNRPSTPAPATTASPATASPAAALTPAAPAATSAVPAAASQQPPVTQQSWTMPDMVGSNLQDAQDEIQQLTGYGIAITTSHDESGEDRAQVLDRNWKVCSQNVSPGETITPDTEIDFGAVKLDERC